jgi:flagellar biosynthesis regulator FlaF
MKEFGLENSAMFWVDSFFKPIPLMGDGDKTQLITQPQLKKLQNLVLQSANSKYPYEKIDKNGGLIVLDIEHIPSLVSYAEKEFLPYGSIFSKLYDEKKMEKNGRKIVSEAIAKKLKSIKAVKEILPNSKVGLWDSIAKWYRYDEIKRNKDHRALAKGIDIDWLRNYEQWHKKDSMIYKKLIDVVDYVMPSLYPAFDLNSKEGQKKQLGFMMSKLMEIKRLNPDTTVIASICPQYTESWADTSGYAKKPMQKGVFTWYINQLYFLYQNGFIDSVSIWGDNEITTFTDYTKQDWWFELIKFTNHLKKP